VATKNYVRIRQSNGSLSADVKGAPTHILREIGETAKVNDQGHIYWQTGFLYPRLELALQSAFAVLDPCGKELNEHDAWGIVERHGILPIIKESPGKPVAVEEVLKRANEGAAEFFRRPRESYRLVTSLSIANFPGPEIICRGARIAPLASREPQYPLPRVLNSRQHGSVFAKHLRETKYQHVEVGVEAITMHQAVDEALNALSLLRGYWSLFATFGKLSWHFGRPEKRSLGVIHTGPVHTLHLAEGKAANEDIYWYDPDYIEDRPLFKGGDEWESVERDRVLAMEKVASLKYGPELEALLIRYAAALDHLTPSIAFLQMWGILEKLTDTVGAKYEETISRTIWVYSEEDRPLVKNMLESLRLRRNQYVHSGETGREADQVSQTMKDFVDRHLIRLIRNDFKVESLNEYAEFLSLSTNVEHLKKKQDKLTRAIQFLTQEESDEEDTQE
jgi:hypothetical protein